MVKKIDKAPLPETARRIAVSVRGLMAENGVTQARIASALGRSNAYVSERVSGLEAWNFAELDVMAGPLGFDGVFDLFAEVARRADRQAETSRLDNDGSERETWVDADPAE